MVTLRLTKAACAITLILVMFGLAGFVVNPGGGGGGAVSPLTLTSTATSQIPLTIAGASGQTGDLQDWVDNNNNPLMTLSPNAVLAFPQGGAIQTGNSGNITMGISSHITLSSGYILDNGTGAPFVATNTSGSYYGLIENDGAHQCSLAYGASYTANGTPSISWFDNGDASLGGGVSSTTATAGFGYIPSVSGTPTGVPTSRSGFVACVYDVSAHKLWVYDTGSSAWVSVLL